MNIPTESGDYWVSTEGRPWEPARLEIDNGMYKGDLKYGMHLTFLGEEVGLYPDQFEDYEVIFGGPVVCPLPPVTVEAIA